MSDIKPSLLDTDRPGGLQRVSSRQPAVGTGKIPSEIGGSFNQELQKAQTESTASSALLGQAYIPSTGKGLDKGVHHRLPDGNAVTYDDIRRAIAEGRGNEDVSPYFTGQTNTQALAAYDFANGVEKMPVVAGAVVAVSQRSIFSLLSSITDAFGFGPKIRSAMNQTSPEQEKSVAAAADDVKKVSKN